MIQRLPPAPAQELRCQAQDEEGRQCAHWCVDERRLCYAHLEELEVSGPNIERFGGRHAD